MVGTVGSLAGVLLFGEAAAWFVEDPLFQLLRGKGGCLGPIIITI
jgi:hypothetical protein